MDRKRRDFLSATAAAVTLSAGLPAKLAHASESPSKSAATQAAQQAQPSAPAAAAYNAPAEIKAIEFINLRELEPAAQKVIPGGGFGYTSTSNALPSHRATSPDIKTPIALSPCSARISARR
jgi:hypothetical protein